MWSQEWGNFLTLILLKKLSEVYSKIMKFDYNDCYDEVEYIEIDTKTDIDYKVLNDIKQHKQKIKKNNKKIKNKNDDE